MLKKCLFVTLLLLFSFSCPAKTPADFAKYYKVDMDEEFPPLEELIKKHLANNSDYDRKYQFASKIGNVFDAVFRNTITVYGSSEERIRSETEEDLIEMLKSLPKEYYQYLGPLIHASYGMPEKVKNMPGIKETKNKFPTRIAPQLADVEDLEFLSPHLYILLMPELWPSNLREQEYMNIKLPKDIISANVKLPDNFMQKIHKIVPPEDFYPDAEEKTDVLKDLRTLHPTENSPLTKGDIRAFTGTISKVDAFVRNKVRLKRIIDAGIYLDLYEKDQGTALPVNTLKDIVNPCQRMVQKIKLAGFQSEFAHMLAQDGFDVKGWAYTCDKTVKAYRKSRMSSNMMQSLIDFKRRVYENYIRSIASHKNMYVQFATIQSVIEMYDSPREDWFNVMDSYKNLTEEFEKLGYKIGTAHVSP